jgi:hypothetical protein
VSVRSILKWVGIVIGLAVLGVIGFIVAAWLSPGDPGRSYMIAALALATLAVLWRLFAPPEW